MKFGKLFAMLAMVAVATTACQNEPEGIIPEGGAKEICVTPALANFNRATDTAFEEGDKIGLHIVTETPWLNNALFTYTNGALVGARANYWYTEDKVSTVVGYYPYSSDGAYTKKYTFSVNADQSTYAKYTASDLMVAITSAKPTSEAIELPFKHVLSKVVITVDNQLNGEQIDDVWFAEVYGNVTVDLTDGSVVATGNKGTIKAASTTLIPEQPAWALILAPQVDVTPKLVVTTVSKKQFTFELKDAVTFSSGKVSTAHITLTDDSIYTDFTPTISDWVGDNELQFGQNPEEGGNEGGDNEGGNTGGEVITDGTLYLHPGIWNDASAWFAAYFFGNGEATMVMTDSDNDGVYECGVPSGMTNVIFCRMNPQWTEFNWNKWENDKIIEQHVWNQTEDLVIGVEPDNHFFVTGWGTEKSQGTWNNSTYDPSTDLAGKESGLGVVGGFAASSWGTDISLLTTTTEGLLVAKNISFNAGEAFKIRTIGTWDQQNIGAGAISIAEANKYFAVTGDNAGDISVVAAGTYDIYFDQNAMRVYLMTAGTPYTEAVEQTANGQEAEPEQPESTEKTIYFSTGSVSAGSGATRYAAYFWNTTTNTNTWASMTDSDGDKIYEVNIPVGYGDNVIFCSMKGTGNNWNNKVNQTSDLIIPTDGKNLYTLSGSWTSGSWKTK